MQATNSVDVGAVLQRVANARFQAEERARSSDLTSVLAVNSCLGGQASTDQLLTSIAEQAARVLRVDSVGFRLREGDDLVLAGVLGIAAQAVRPRIRIGENASGRVVAERRPLLVDIGHDGIIDELTRDALQRHGYTHYLGVPLEIGGETIGMLGFDARRPFSARDVEVAQAFASQAAVAIGHARLYQEATRREERVRALADLGRLLSETLDPETVGQRIVDSLCALLGATNAGLYRLRPGSSSLVLTARTGSVWAWVRRLPLGEGVAGLALRERRPHASADVSADPAVVLSPAMRDRMAAMPNRAVLAAPLIVGEHLLGALVVGDHAGRAWNEEEMQLTGAFADQAALALQNARLHEAALTSVMRLEALLEVNRTVGSTLDPLTVADRVVEAARQLVPDCVAELWEIAPGTGEVVLIAERGAGRAVREHTRMREGAGLAGGAAAAGRRIVSPNLLEDVRISQPRWFAEEGLISGVSLPLLHGGTQYGALCLFTRARYDFTEAEMGLLESFAAQVAAAIANARAFRREEDRARRLTTLTELTRLITAARDTREVFKAVVAAAATLLGAKFARVLVHDPGTDVLRTEEVFCVGAALERAILMLPPNSVGEGLSGEAFASAAPVYVRDVQADARSRLQAICRDFGIHGAGLIPLRAGDRVVGILSIGFGDRRDFSAEDKELMGLLADQAAIAISNKRGEENLRALASETGNIVTSITSILVAVDAHDRITRWNAAAEATLGIATGRVLGRPLQESGIDWDWSIVRERIAECRATRAPVHVDDVRFPRAAGREGILSLTIYPIQGATEVRGLLILGDDVTERRVMEVQFSQAQKLESIGQLAAGIAHEINTPIQFVGDNVRFLQGALGDLERLIAACQRLRAGAADAALAGEIRAVEDEIDVAYLVSEMPKAVSQTLEGVERVATIVRALKEFAHPDRKEKAATDLNQAILSTLTVARNEIKYVADVETDLGELPPVMCCAGELNQVFLNIVVNAAHAIGDVVRASGGRGRIRVETRRDGADVVIAIGDTGGGIPEAIRSRVFDPFFTTKSVGRGTGQGLAIARNVVVDKHGGTVGFDSETGRGTTFVIRLPIQGTTETSP